MSSQLEKFNRRSAKMKADTVVIKEENLKNSTPEKQGEKIAKQHGLTTEDIFAVITRESMGPFIKMWNNSMETVIRETIRTEIRSVMEDVVQEQLVGAFKGIMKGMTPEIDIDIKEVVKEKVVEFIKEDTVEEAIACPIVTENDKLQIDKTVSVEEAIIMLHEAGIDPTKGNNLKKRGGRWATLYLTFMKANKGVKGAWHDYAMSVIEANFELNKNK